MKSAAADPVPGEGAPMVLLPAMDVSGGEACQVVGDQVRDPFVVADRWVQQGAAWVHLVDLDRAYRRGNNLPLLAELIATIGVPVQLSGGLDSEVAIGEALDTGAARINLAASALRDLDAVAALLAEHGDRVAVGIDVAAGQVVARGSGENLGPVAHLLDRLREALGEHSPAAYLVADASRDGRRAGADHDLFARMVADLDAPVIASGGVATLEDLTGLAATGVAGVVLGSALYHGSFTLADALAVVGEAPRHSSGWSGGR